MLYGLDDPQNVGAVVLGVVNIVQGLVLCLNRRRIASFMGGFQSPFGNSGRSVAKRSTPALWAAIGVGFVVIGALAVVLGLFAEFAPPGTVK